MTDLTDDAVKALLDGATPDWTVYSELDVGLPPSLFAGVPGQSGFAPLEPLQGHDLNLAVAAPDLARALLQARAECDGAHMIIATERAEVVRLRTENARLRADAQAAVALVVERAVTACSIAGVDEEDEFDRGYSAGRRSAIAAIRALAPLDGLAMVEALRKERDEFWAVSETLSEMHGEEVARGDRLTADLAAAQAQIKALRGALEITADEATSDEIPGGYLPPESPDWHRGYDAAIRKARAALAALPAKAG